jgi:mannitol-1-phosphate/altronate dehydrogenase
MSRFAGGRVGENLMTNVLRLRPNTVTPLTNNTIGLHAQRLAVPGYDRSALRPSIVHIGVGGFHRAHQGSYFDDLAKSGISMDWGVIGVGLHRRETKDALTPQDCLYTLVECGADRVGGRVVGSLCQYLFAPDEQAAVIAALVDERTRLVTLTITGGGYYRDPTSGDFDSNHPAVRHDLDGRGPYETAWAYLVDALDQRRRNGGAPFTVMSCDNLPDNGDAARQALVGFAAQRDTELAGWIERTLTFPSTMVDRITPKITEAQKAMVAKTFGVADRSPVVTEPFRQWVIEDAFCNGRPPLDEVGVDMVTDVAPYKLIKTRLLNGSHCALSYLGILLGKDTTDTAMCDLDIYTFMDQLMCVELCPLLPETTDFDLADYRKSVLTRLSNPGIADNLSRLAARGSTKMPSYLLPSIAEARAQQRPTTLLTLALAAWMRYLRGYDLQGCALTVEDQRADQLTGAAKTGLSDPRPLLSLRDIFGHLGEDVEFVSALETMLRDIDRVGLACVLSRVLDGRPRSRDLQRGNHVAAPSFS